MEYINLDITPGSIPPIVNCSQCDIGREIALILFDGTSGEWSIPEGSTVYIIGTKSDGHPFGYDSVSNPDIITWSDSTVTVKTVYQMTAAAGEAECEVRIKSSAQEIYTANFILDVESMAWPQDDELSTIDIPLIVKAINAESGSVESAAQAAASATAAKTSEINAKASETAAKNSQTAAANSATASANSASASATSASKAATSESNASKSATAAANSATASASSATKAATSESNASKSATAAKTSETNASNSAELSESWAVGGTGSRSGEDSNNSKYYAEQAKKSADQAASTVTGVSTWNGRAGAVTPQKGDYTADMVGALASSDVDSALSTTSTNPVQNKAIATGGFTILNNLTIDSSKAVPKDTQYFIIQRSASEIYRKPLSDLWSYIKSKISSVLGITEDTATEVDNLATEGKFVISASGWSSTTTTKNGSDYYTYTVNCSAITLDHPIIGPSGATDVPTADEQTAYDCVAYAVADTSAKTITLYADTLPRVSFYIIVKGAK